MDKTLKKVLIIIGIVILVVIIGVVTLTVISVKSYSDVQDKADLSVNRGNAAVLAQAINTHNILSDDIINELPDTLDEFVEMETTIAVTLSDEDYEGALPYVAFDDEGDAYVIDEDE